MPLRLSEVGCAAAKTAELPLLPEKKHISLPAKLSVQGLFLKYLAKSAFFILFIHTFDNRHFTVFFKYQHKPLGNK